MHVVYKAEGSETPVFESKFISDAWRKPSKGETVMIEDDEFKVLDSSEGHLIKGGEIRFKAVVYLEKVS